MSVVPLTLTISLCLVFTFVVFFLREHSRRRFSGAESETLLPLAEETPRLVGHVSGHAASSRHEQQTHTDDHAHAHAEACRGNNTCSSCQRRAERRARRAAEAAASQQA